MTLISFQIKIDVVHISNILKRLSQRNKSQNSNFTRAVLSYLPPNMDGFQKEFKALYLSVAVMRTSQPDNIKTDFIIFTPKESVGVALSVGCVREVR